MVIAEHCSVRENPEERSSHPYTLFTEFIFYNCRHFYGNEDSSVTLVTRLHAGSPLIVFWFLAWIGGFSALQEVQTLSGNDSASYAKKTWCPLPRGKVTASSSWPLAANYAELKKERSFTSCYIVPLWSAPQGKLCFWRHISYSFRLNFSLKLWHFMENWNK